MPAPRKSGAFLVLFWRAKENNHSDLLDGNGPLAREGLIGLQHLVLAFLIDAVGPAVPRLHADEALGVLLPEHAVGEALVGVHGHLVAVALVGEGHGELHAGHQADGVVRALLAGQGDLFRGGGLLALGVLGAGSALDVKIHILQRGSGEVGVVTEAEGHRDIPLVDDGHTNGSGGTVQVVVHQQGEVEGVEELGQRSGLQNKGHAVGANPLHFPCAEVCEAVALHGVGLAVKQVDATVRVAAAGEEHRHTEPGAVALAEVGAAGPDVLVAVEGEAGDHAAALRGDDQLGLCLGIGDNVLLIAGTVFGDVTGGDLIHSSVLLMFLVLCQFFKIIINAIAYEIFYDPCNNGHDSGKNAAVKQERIDHHTGGHSHKNTSFLWLTDAQKGRRAARTTQQPLIFTERRRP